MCAASNALRIVMMLRCVECDDTTELGRGWKAYLGGEPDDYEEEVRSFSGPY